MSTYRDVFYQSSDGLRLYARDYQHAAPRATLLCMHGLTRNSADFSALCEDLADDYRIISVDQRGRGLSEYDPEPGNYNPQTYVGDMLTLLDHLGIEQVIAIGTSMGGVISMALGAAAARRLGGVILNDIGPEIDPTGLERIRGYVGQLPPVRTWDEAAAQVKATNVIAFPDYRDDDWLRFARNVYRENDDGVPVVAYDPAISQSVSANRAAVDMWPLFDALASLPVLVIRGETSDILAPDCVAEMRRRRPDLETADVPNRGHAPMLDESVAAQAIRAFLRRASGEVE